MLRTMEARATPDAYRPARCAGAGLLGRRERLGSREPPREGARRAARVAGPHRSARLRPADRDDGLRATRLALAGPRLEREARRNLRGARRAAARERVVL